MRLDRIDRQIVALLLQDGRMSSAEITRRIVAGNATARGEDGVTGSRHDGGDGEVAARRETRSKDDREPWRLSERSVRYRIERLRQRGVILVSAVVLPQAVGYSVIGDVMLEVAPGRLREVAERLVTFENVSYVAGSVGDGDLSIQVYARSNDELLRFVEEEVGKVPGVTRTRTVMVPWKLKDVYQWQLPATLDVKEGARQGGGMG